MNILRKGTAALLAILFVITALASLFLFNFERKAFTVETYQLAFANQDFYDHLPAIMAEALMTSPQVDNLPVGLRGLSTQKWETFIRELLPPETLQSMGNEALVSIFAYLNNESDIAEFSLLPLKQRMSKPEAVQAVLELLKTQPPCTLTQIAQMTVAALADRQITLCNPPAESIGLITPIIQTQLQLAAAVIPDQVTLISAPPAGQKDPRAQLKVARLVMQLSPLVALALLLGVTLLAVDGFNSWLKWWGYPLFVTGLLASLMGLAGAPLAQAFLPEFLAHRMPTYLPTILLNNGSQLAAAILEQLLRPVTLQGLALGGIGLVMVIIATLVKQKKPAN